jgi:hypothetical protein
MNRYHILVTAGTPYVNHKVEANGIGWSDSGLYEFWRVDENGRRYSVAFYPVNRTIIENIEYGIDE